MFRISAYVNMFLLGHCFVWIYLLIYFSFDPKANAIDGKRDKGTCITCFTKINESCVKLMFYHEQKTN